VHARPAQARHSGPPAPPRMRTTRHALRSTRLLRGPVLSTRAAAPSGWGREQLHAWHGGGLNPGVMMLWSGLAWPGPAPSSRVPPPGTSRPARPGTVKQLFTPAPVSACAGCVSRVLGSLVVSDSETSLATSTTASLLRDATRRDFDAVDACAPRAMSSTLHNTQTPTHLWGLATVNIGPGCGRKCGKIWMVEVG